ncbi:PLP-dependent aminotransferase family protein [Actinophytocola sp. NPDC049390]|uniref:MocR-like pyridoxine biosynthesis transcription factor PdxR n=1 Tax=Actinophytocola sp. NPDC049390 TaxID=3363894 RepID=UPI0037953EA2
MSGAGSPVPDLLIALDRDSTVPLHRQIESAIRDRIRTGHLRKGAVLPPTRTVAASLGVSRGVVVEAYQQLAAEGYVTSRPGGYTHVAVDGTAPARGDSAVPAHRPRIDFGYGRADGGHFPRSAWSRSLRTVLADTPDDRLNYLSGHGVPELRDALCAYLDRVRGTAARPEHTVICNGYAQGIALIVRVLADAGAATLAVEDPSSLDDAVPLARAAGLSVVGVPVSEDGIDVAALARSGADAVVLTPSHQWPLGGILPAASRSAVLAWAADTGALVVEDDYDAEYRYDRAPVGAMQGLAPEHVVYAGSVSKTLAPGLRIGWLLVPARLSAAVAEAKLAADRGSPAIDQLAFADFLTRGEFDRHLRRMRPVYRRRRDALLAALSARLPDLTPVGAAAGLHLVAWLPPDLDEPSVVAAALDRGVGVHGVGDNRLGGPGRQGLLFGYASLSERAIAEGVGLLADAVADVRAHPATNTPTVTAHNTSPAP